MQLPSCRSCHALTGASHSGIAKSVASKGYGPSPGAKQGCSNLSGRHRPSAICSNAVRAKLPVKNRSSVSKSLSTHLEVLYPHAESVLNEPCVQALLLAGALDCKAGSSTGQRQWNSLQCSPVHGSEAGPTSPIKPQQNNPEKGGPPTHNQEPRDHQGPNSKNKRKARGGNRQGPGWLSSAK